MTLGQRATKGIRHGLKRRLLVTTLLVYVALATTSRFQRYHYYTLGCGSRGFTRCST